MRRLLPAAAAILLAALPAAAQASALTPLQVGEVFCLARIAGDSGPIEGLLTPDLEAAIAAAEQRSAELQEQFPDDKPPLGDGIPWQGFPDQASRCEAARAAATTGAAEIPIAYGFAAAPDADFVDTLVLRPVPDNSRPGHAVWRIDDVIYEAGDSLRAVLEAAATAD